MVTQQYAALLFTRTVSALSHLFQGDDFRVHLSCICCWVYKEEGEVLWGDVQSMAMSIQSEAQQDIKRSRCIQQMQ